MPKFPIRDNLAVPIGPLRGQQSRPPPTRLEAGVAAISDGASFQGGDLQGTPGWKKLTTSAIPSSAYEIQPITTGCLQIPTVSGIDFTSSAAEWAITVSARLLNAGAIFDSATADDETAAQLFMATDTVQGTGPRSETNIMGLRVYFIKKTSSGVEDYYLRVKVGDNPGQDTKLEIDSTAIDLTDWFKVMVGCKFDHGTAAQKLIWSVWQPQTFSDADDFASGNYEVTAIPMVRYFSFGGIPTARDPWYGIRHPCPMVLAEVQMWNDQDATGAKEVGYTRKVASDIAGSLKQVWPLRDSSASQIAPLTGTDYGQLWGGNRVHRTSSTIGSSTSSLRFPGGAGLFIPESSRLRAPPGAESPTFFLERPELSLGFWFRPEVDPKTPFYGGENGDNKSAGGVGTLLDRSILLNWVTPKGLPASIGGHAEDVTLQNYWHTDADGRPLEHLRIELRRDTTTDIYQLACFWGELYVDSLAGKAYPPSLDKNGKLPAVYNLPQGTDASTTPEVTLRAITDPTAQNVQLIELGPGTSAGDDVGVDDPLQYDWLIIAEREFVGIGSASNEALFTAYPFNRSTGAWASSQVFRYRSSHIADDTGFVRDQTIKGTDSGGAGSTRSKTRMDYPSGYCIDNGPGVIRANYRKDNYVLSLGVGCPGDYGDECNVGGADKGFRPSDNLEESIQPTSGDPGFIITSHAIGHPFQGEIASFFAVSKFLTEKDRTLIASTGSFNAGMREQFSKNLLMSYNFDEGGGNVLRDAMGGDCSYYDRIMTWDSGRGLSKDEEIPKSIGFYPRADPPRHNEAEVYVNESSQINGIVQRVDAHGNEEIYIVAQPGLYEYSRTAYTLTRLLTLPGQGGPGRASIVVDNNDVIHIGGGPGRLVIITRDKTIAVSGVDRPQYQSSDDLVTQSTGDVTGARLGFTFYSAQGQSPDDVKYHEIPDRSQMMIAVGYYSDILKTRSAPGPPYSLRYSDPNPPGYGGTGGTLAKWRVLITNMPLPTGDNKHLITHWEIYRSYVNAGDGRLFLETKIPIGEERGSSFAGYKIDLALGHQADFFRDIAPEGINKIGLLGERLFGVGLPDGPRSLIWSRLKETTIWPPIYEYTLSMTSSPITGVKSRRDRAFATSRDYLYQVFDTGQDVDPDGRLVDPIRISPLTEGIGALTQDAIADDEENGLYIPGNKSIYLTEGGLYRSLTGPNDSVGTTGLSWSWPDSWDLSDPDAFLSFHDQQRRMIGIVGPSADDSSRRDALCLFYEKASTDMMGRSQVTVEATRITDIDCTATAHVLNQADGSIETWFGGANGYVYKFGEGNNAGVDYNWLANISPKVGLIQADLGSNKLRLEAAYSGKPSDLFIGNTFRVYRKEVLISANKVTSVTLASSSTDVTLDGDPLALPGDFWTVGALPLDWRSGEMSLGEDNQDIRCFSADLRLKRTT